MKRIYFLLILFIIPFFNAMAADSKISLALTSNYVIRGISQTDDKSVVQVAYQVSESKDLGFYAGAFASNVALGTEVDIYGGFALAIGGNDAFILDMGAIEYIYNDTNFAPISHEYYIGIQYDKSYLKTYYGENEELYLDLGTGFNIWGDIALLLHYGEVFSAPQNGKDFSITLQKDFELVRFGLTRTYEDKTATKESELFAYISTGF